MRVTPSPLLLTAVLIAFPSSSPFAGAEAYALSIKDHRFDPAELMVPAGRKIRLTVHNLDSTPEEFESYELNREKVIPGGRSADLYLGPLKPGRYPFFGEFHEDSAQGVIVAE